jgi:hypothetical protein
MVTTVPVTVTEILEFTEKPCPGTRARLSLHVAGALNMLKVLGAS